jgi:hypothetical protein
MIVISLFEFWFLFYFKALFYFIIFTFIYMCIHYLGHPPPPLSGRTCSTLSFSDFVEEKTWDYKKNIVFLLVWEKTNYTERFLALLPCTCVLQPTLVHLCSVHYFQDPSHRGLCQLKITIFTPIQWAHQPHSSFRFPSLSLFLPCSFSP